MTPGIECRVRDCNGRWHYDNTCDVILADLQGAGASLIAEVDAAEGGPVELVVWEGEDGRDLLRTSDPAAGHAFADRLRALAAAVDKGAGLLTPVPVEPVDYAARFADLNSDVLFALEDQGDCDAASEYVKSLLVVLAEWRPRVLALLAETPAGQDVPEAAAYQQALDRTREAWLQYSFRYEGGPTLPYPFDLPEMVNPTSSKGHAQAVTPAHN